MSTEVTKDGYEVKWYPCVYWFDRSTLICVSAVSAVLTEETEVL